tara:strand:+ start:175 stop:531 length:357 start_codon:yes stop_codon:yes gene_type:complete
MVKNIDNIIINEIYRLYYCIDYNAIRWKRYTIPVLLDRLQRYNEDKYNKTIKKIDIYYDRHELEYKVYEGAYDDFEKLISEKVIDAGVGDYMLRDKFKRWIHHQRIYMSKPLNKSRLS